MKKKLSDWSKKNWHWKGSGDPIGCLKYMHHFHTGHLHHFIGLVRFRSGPLTKIWEKFGRLTLILGIMTLIFRENIHINGLNKCLKEFASALIVGKGLSSKSSSLEHAFFMKKQGLHANIMFVKSYILTNIDIYWSPACV